MSHRTFLDAQANEWFVWEVRPDSPKVSRSTARGDATMSLLPGALAEGWLCFQCATERRRLAPIPPQWTSLSDEALLALCARATPARLTRRVVE